VAILCAHGRWPRPTGITGAAAGALVSLVLLHLLVPKLCNVVVALGRPGSHRVEKKQEKAQQRIERALQAFRKGTGAYPMQLADLTASALPANGLDSSGNEVAIDVKADVKMPLLRRIPDDPLTGRNDTWVYDVRSLFLVESGGYNVTVTAQTHE